MLTDRAEPMICKRENTSLGRFVKEEAAAVEYLKTPAISRIYRDNILNIQSSWVTPGLKICQVGLRFGGNDVGSIMIEETVSPSNSTSDKPGSGSCLGRTERGGTLTVGLADHNHPCFRCPPNDGIGHNN
jgi:hypothetical protein